MPGLGLSEFADILSRLESRAIQARPQQCTRLRHRLSTCTLCADVCPTGAIQWADGLVVDPEKCTGCGACATVCPTGALVGQSPTDAELVARIHGVVKESGNVAFACKRYLSTKPVAAAVAVNCLARLDESLLVAAVAFGAKRVWLLDGSCGDCPEGTCRSVAEVCAGRANRLLGAFGLENRIALVPHLDVDVLTAFAETQAEGMSRRGFFNMLVRQTARVGAITTDSVLTSQGLSAEKEMKKGELPTLMPEKRLLLLAALKRLGRVSDGDHGAAGGLWNKFQFTETCTGCQMCAFFCPTGALTKWEQDGRVGVAFQVSRCVACGLCRDSCYVKAVVLWDDVDLSVVLSETVEALPMRAAEAAPWRKSGSEGVARNILESLDLTNE